MKAFSRIVGIVAIAALVVAAFFIGMRTTLFQGKHVEEQADVLLQQVKSACKLITAEGYFTEIYDYKDYYYWDISPLRKKALIRIKARVSVGYDLEKMHIEALPEEKRIAVSSIPELEVLSIEHELDYYDISQGSFNAFGVDDYNHLNKRAKDYIRNVALSSELVDQARERGLEIIDYIRMITESAGWTLDVEEPAVFTLSN